MAYPYYPAYQPAPYSVPQFATQGGVTMPQQPQTPQSANIGPQTGASIIWISGGEQAASAYPVAPNAAVALWDQAAPVVYLKQADASGKPSMTIYDLVERKPTPPTPPEEWATKAELAAVLSTIRAELAALKGDETHE